MMCEIRRRRNSRIFFMVCLTVILFLLCGNGPVVLSQTEEKHAAVDSEPKSITEAINLVKASGPGSKVQGLIYMSRHAEETRTSPELAKEVIGCIRDSLTDTERPVKRAAVQAVIHYTISATSTIPNLIKLIDTEKDSDISWFAAEALGEFGPLAKDAVPILLKAVQNKASPVSGPSLCEKAIIALGQIGPASKDALPELKKMLLEDTGYLGVQSAEAIGRIDPDDNSPYPYLNARLRNGDPYIKRLSLTALRSFGRNNRDESIKLANLAISDPDDEIRSNAAELIDYLSNRPSTQVN